MNHVQTPFFKRLFSPLIVVFALLILAVPSTNAQEARPLLWRTLLVSTSNPAVGQTTTVTLTFGNWGAQPATINSVGCAIGKQVVGPSNDLLTVSVTRGGQAVPFTLGSGLLTINDVTPFTLLPNQSRTYRIRMRAVENTRGENIVSCGATYTVNGERNGVGDSVIVAIWR